MIERINHAIRALLGPPKPTGIGAVAMPILIGHHYKVECFRGGQLIWTEEYDNIVVTAGLNDILDKYYKGSSYTAAHYVGLKLTGSMVAGDTMSSHGGWAESSSYDEATRPALTPGTVSGGSVDNSASKAVFTISATVTITGAFVTTNSTKGGTTGTLVGGGEFSVSRSVVDNDVLNVTVTASLTSS
jgi:hypothetical protein